MPVRTEDLSEIQNHESLALLILLKENRDGSIKGCKVADGRIQQEKIEPKDATYPTVSTEAVMFAETIDALEVRDVVVVYIPGEYLSANVNDEVHIVFRGTPEKLIVASDPELYRPLISYETGQAVIYVRLNNALYGCLKTALLFYEKLVGYLEAYGFRINPYNPCVSNKMVGWKHLTVCWNMDDLKISCVDANEVKK